MYRRHLTAQWAGESLAAISGKYVEVINALKMVWFAAVFRIGDVGFVIVLEDIL